MRGIETEGREEFPLLAVEALQYRPLRHPAGSAALPGKSDVSPGREDLMRMWTRKAAVLATLLVAFLSAIAPLAAGTRATDYQDPEGRVGCDWE